MTSPGAEVLVGWSSAVVRCLVVACLTVGRLHRVTASRIRSRVLGSLTAIALAALLVSAAPGLSATATAKTFTVTKRGDPAPGQCKPKDCSLREAVIAANVRPGRDVIELRNRRKPYNLRQAGAGDDAGFKGDLDINNNPLVIKHPGRGRATIDANGIDRVFEVFAGAPTTFRKLVITGGGATTFGQAGGGIRSDSNLRVIRSRIAGNSVGLATGGGIAFGLGLENGVGLKLVHSVVARNEAGSNGGGIRGRGAIELIHSRIVRNAGRFGGGLALLLFPTARSRIVDSTIAGNTATKTAVAFASRTAAA